MEEQMQQMIARVNELSQQSTGQQQSQALLAAQNEELSRKLQQQAAAAATSHQSGDTRAAQGTAGVQKWAPDAFNGKKADWPDWSLKFRSYMGAMLGGATGR